MVPHRKKINIFECPLLVWRGFLNGSKFVDKVIVNYGFVSSWGLDKKRNAILVNLKQETNIPGIYEVEETEHMKKKPCLLLFVMERDHSSQ